MIEQGVLYVQHIISVYGIWGVLAATLIEEIIAPIPSGLVPLAAGFFLLPAEETFALVAVEAILLVALPVAIGMSFGSALVYAIGYYGGKPLIEKHERFLGISWKDIERIEKRVIRGNRDELTLFLLRLVPIIPGVAISGFCGIVRYPFSRFMLVTFLGSGLRAYALGLAGWQGGEFYFKYVEVFDRFEHLILLGVVGLVAIGVLYYSLRKKRR